MASNSNAGKGLVYSCLHGGSNDYSGGDTVWYNYVTASAGTIANKNASDTTGTMNTATESVCPKGWTLPSGKQITDGSFTSDHNPVLGGFYFNATPAEASTRGHYWGAEAVNSLERYEMQYRNTGTSFRSSATRRQGFYIRCVSEEKTVTDLTYMQDMTKIF